MKEKACQQMSFTDWFWKVSSPNSLSVLLTRRKKGDIMLPVCVLSANWTAISTAMWLKTNPQRFLVEDFFLLVIKPPWTYFNNELLHSCRSSKFSSLLPAFFCVLRWIQFVLLEIQRVTAKCFNFSRTNIAMKVAKSHNISYQVVFQHDSFSNNLNWIYAEFCHSARATFKEDSLNGRPHLNFFIVPSL